MPEHKHNNFPEGRTPHASDPHHPHGGGHADMSAGQHGHGRHPDSGHAAKSADPSCITSRLKAETQDLHQAAEQHELQRALFKGRLPREVYAQHLGQLYLVHKALEGHIRRVRPSVPALAAVVKDYQFQEPYAEADLRTYGVDPASVRPTPSTKQLIESFERIAKTDPLALLGHHYVLEGSNNGSRFIAMAVRKAYALTPGQGDRYLDPYGDEQPARWAEFKRDLAAQKLTDAQKDTLVRAAREMFAGIKSMNDDLAAPAKL